MADIHLYVGIEKKRTSDSALVTLILEGKNAKPLIISGYSMDIPPDRKSPERFYHFVLLKALEYGIAAIHSASDQAFRIVFHPDNDRIYFEYVNERQKDGRYSDSAYDLDIWQRIDKALKKRGSELIIASKDNCLSYLGRLNRR